MSNPQTTIERDAAARRELEDRDKEWAAIYDACAHGNGQTGFELFEKALLRTVIKGAMTYRRVPEGYGLFCIFIGIIIGAFGTTGLVSVMLILQR